MAIIVQMKSTLPVEIEFTIDELREITRWAVLCAHRVLSIYESSVSDDSRPRDAIAAADAFVKTGKRSNALRMAGLAAYKASRETDIPAAREAAQAATQAVGAAYLHPLASALQVKHILGSAAHALCAIEISDQKAAKEFYDWVLSAASVTVGEVLVRFPSAPAGGGRTGEIMREFDSALRTRQ